VRLQSIVTPLTEFDHPEKGDALYGELLSSSTCVIYFFIIAVVVDQLEANKVRLYLSPRLSG
jgi:hypothetical protein